MPYVNVHVDVEDVLSDCSESELTAALADKRRERGKLECEIISRRDSLITLDDAAQVLRKLNRYDLAHRLDEIREDYF